MRKIQNRPAQIPRMFMPHRIQCHSARHPLPSRVKAKFILDRRQGQSSLSPSIRKQHGRSWALGGIALVLFGMSLESTRNDPGFCRNWTSFGSCATLVGCPKNCAELKLLGLMYSGILGAVTPNYARHDQRLTQHSIRGDCGIDAEQHRGLVA